MQECPCGRETPGSHHSSSGYKEQPLKVAQADTVFLKRPVDRSSMDLGELLSLHFPGFLEPPDLLSASLLPVDSLTCLWKCISVPMGEAATILSNCAGLASVFQLVV